MNKAANVTPMMAQFLEIKAEYPTALLFYRMGDFYELFFDDALAAAEALDIALTKRGKHLGEDIPMCGVPVHAAEGYLLNLIRKGFRVAVCEQLENPKEAKKRGAKSVVKRGVVRLVTPGTLTEDSLLQPRRSNFLAALATVRDRSTLAWVDISTGEVRFTDCPHVRLGAEMARLAVRELLIPDDTAFELVELAEENGAAVTFLAPQIFDSSNAADRLATAYGIGDLSGFGDLSRADLAALGALIEYLTLTQKGNLPLLRRPLREEKEGFVSIDAATRRNLELTETLSGERKGSLISVVDKSVTAAGARRMMQRITAPSRAISDINDHLDAISFFQENSLLETDIREILRSAPDMERALGRMALGRSGPRDLQHIGRAITQADAMFDLLRETARSKNVLRASDALTGQSGLAQLLGAALAAEVPILARDGGFVAPGYSAELDEVKSLRDEARSVIAAMQADYANQTGIGALKVKHNNVLGYFIETPATHAEKMLAAPLSETFIHRQTTANAVRFTTVELSALETKILNAAGRAIELELEIFDRLCAETLAQSDALQAMADGLAEIDVMTALSHLARGSNWNRPSLTGGKEFYVEQGRHPVVERALAETGEQLFVANDCNLSSDPSAIWLLTGPNMAGKSTFLRQNALIAILAQAGSFVPAARAEIGVISQIFSRVGASDDLARGRSTFMVEMVETAAILNQADENALVIVDEIGRGTSTYDGLSIAWATLEHLHESNQCRALFATHYHELTQVAAKLDRVDCATVTVREFQGEVVFLHEVKKGAADRSYGVQVAKLAGLPDAVIERARIVLNALEKGERERGASPNALVDDLPLFSANPSPGAPVPSGPSTLDLRLSDINPDTLSPREALELIYELKALNSK